VLASGEGTLDNEGAGPRKTGERSPVMAEKYEGYCVKCRAKREFEGEVKDLPNGRKAAQGPCPVCGTKVTRMLGKSA
jgi:uncharacterized protein DUF5679